VTPDDAADVPELEFRGVRHTFGVGTSSAVPVLDGIDLHLARDHAGLGRANHDIEHSRGEVALEDLLPQLVALDGDGLGGLVVTIDDGGDIPLSAGLACGPLACTRARRGFELYDLCHGFSPIKIGP